MFQSIVSKVTGAASVKYYVEQQLSKLQVHYMNKNIFLNVTKKRLNEQKRAFVEEIFSRYEALVQMDKYFWIKVNENTKIQKEADIQWYCIEIGAQPDELLSPEDERKRQKQLRQITSKQKFKGLFPPIAALESTVEVIPFDKSNKLPKNNILTKRIVAYSKSYISEVEYLATQLDTLAIDLSMNLRF